jgi:hypothetical protein
MNSHSHASGKLRKIIRILRWISINNGTREEEKVLFVSEQRFMDEILTFMSNDDRVCDGTFH